MLEQEAQMLGFLDSALPDSLIGSPQQMQILGFTGLNENTTSKHVFERTSTHGKEATPYLPRFLTSARAPFSKAHDFPDLPLLF
jgi:hypothetical protein